MTVDELLQAAPWALRVFGSLTAIIGSVSWWLPLIIDWRVYSDVIQSDEPNVFRALKIGMDSSWTMGGTDYHKKFVPTYIVSRSLSFMMHTHIDGVGMHRHRYLRVTLWRWRWLPPLISVDETVKTCDTVRVHRRALAEDSGSNDTLEEVIPPSHVRHPTFICSDRESALSKMLELHAEQKGQRFLLMGGKGVGKTVLARRFAHKVDAELYANWDPTVPGDNLSSILTLPSRGFDERSIVINFPEVDVAIDRINRSAVVHSKRMRAEVHDKTSWCNTFDFINLVGATVILDTNLTEDEIDVLDARHQGALLRHGRITARIVIQGGSTAMGTASPHAPLHRVDSHAIDSDSDSDSEWDV